MYGLDMIDDQGGTPDAPRLRDYVAWHDAYSDPSSSLSARLRQVQRGIAAWLDRTRGSVGVMSSCARTAETGRADLHVLPLTAEPR